MSADLGGTYIYSVLEELLTKNHYEGYPKQVFLLTDGGVPNTENVIKMVSRNNLRARIYTIGFGNECCEDLIRGCAKKGRGCHVFISDS
jgi:von Willebrand factor A domain-containing protein 5